MEYGVNWFRALGLEASVVLKASRAYESVATEMLSAATQIEYSTGAIPLSVLPGRCPLLPYASSLKLLGFRRECEIHLADYGPLLL